MFGVKKHVAFCKAGSAKALRRGLGPLEKPGLKKQVEFLVRRGLFDPCPMGHGEFRRRQRMILVY